MSVEKHNNIDKLSWSGSVRLDATDSGSEFSGAEEGERKEVKTMGERGREAVFTGWGQGRAGHATNKKEMLVK